ncbi:MAG TPA: SRPBCC family protein [Aeromicrobium sp.]|nr:SRPBCC family protein [Aeromicrobium sp.]
MPSVERTVTIAAPLDKVFAYFTTPENDKQWREELVEVAPEGPMGLNTIIRQTVSAPVIGEVSADTQITAWDPPNGYAFKVIAGPVRPEGTISFAAVDGGTSVTFKLAVNIRGPQKLVFNKPTQSSMNATVAALDKVKAILEA